MTIIEARLAELEHVDLLAGKHQPNDSCEMCFNEQVAYIAGEPWTDHPETECPVITEYTLRLNDRWSHEHRQLLKPYRVRVIGSRASDEITTARIWMLVDWTARTLPAMLWRLAGNEELATSIEAIPEITDKGSLSGALDALAALGALDALAALAALGALAALDALDALAALAALDALAALAALAALDALAAFGDSVRASQLELVDRMLRLTEDR